MFEETKSTHGDHMVMLTLSKSKAKDMHRNKDDESPKAVRSFGHGYEGSLKSTSLRNEKDKTRRISKDLGGRFDIFAFNPMVNTYTEFKYEDIRKIMPDNWAPTLGEFNV